MVVLVRGRKGLEIYHYYLEIEAIIEVVKFPLYFEFMLIVIFFNNV